MDDRNSTCQTNYPDGPRLRSLALIPARGQSKGVPRKNLALLGGRPLIAFTIASALACGRFHRIVVSTDDEEIAAAAREHGAETPFLRPPELATDTALVGAATSHALARLAAQGEHPVLLAVLYPTHPFRPPGLLESLMDRLASGFRAVTCARPLPPGPYADPTTGRALAAPPAGVYRTSGLFEGRRMDAGGCGSYLHLLRDPVTAMDIDTPADLELARAALDAGPFVPPWGAS